MKSLLRDLLPSPVRTLYRRLRLFFDHQQNSRKSAEEVFTDIYRNKKWGDGEGQFCSGPGSAYHHIISPYVSQIYEQARLEGFTGMTFVDLGCGDFSVGKQFLPLCSRYIGVDVVQPLISFNQESYGDATTSFLRLDIAEHDLPDGEVCFLRQVLQHLSNHQIAKILKKLSKYRWVFITEHYPWPDHNARPNVDKVHGADIRLYQNSGVYLTKPPFSIPEKDLKMVLEVPDCSTEEGGFKGVIRTFLYTPQGGRSSA